MSKIININMGEMAVGHNDTRIKTGSIGSCVVVVLYDGEAKVGGMAHAMLPTRKERKTDVVSEARANININVAEAVAKYVDESVDRLVKEIEKIGGKKERLKAKLIGGSSMFRVLSGDKHGIGYQNIEAAKRRLQELGIPIKSEETGGTVGRLAELNLENGLVEVSTKM
ncbi:chemotaxis protein CheD [Patescibacteria group bacterium AH-259-L07]|nr:chemotaxis protein CheD [Patescibacteria group bacterium AH-259-L07]